MKFRLLILTVSLLTMAFGLSYGQSITIDHVDGLEADGSIADGATLVFHFRVTGDADAHFVMSNGFKFYSDDLTWGSCTGTLNPAYKWDLNFGFPCMFDLGFFVNYFSNDGMGADTVGFGGAAGMYGTGLPAGFDDIGWWVEIGPVVNPDPGNCAIYVDSAYYPPAGYWLWDICEENVAWGTGSPYVFGLTTGVGAGADGNLPMEFALKQNYPNPFNPTTEIHFDVPNRANVNISIFNVLGQKVHTLVDEEMAAGSYVRTWNGQTDAGSTVSSGVYFYKMEAGDFVTTKKMMMLK